MPPDDRFSAQRPVIGKDGQARLGAVCVRWAGLGRLNSEACLSLVRVGVRHFLANDPQPVTTDGLGCFLHACPRDKGMKKVTAMERFLVRYPEISFEGLAAPNESPETEEHARRADLTICAANTKEGRQVEARRARLLNKPLIDVSVADGREALAGFVKLWLPKNRDWSACPCCYYEPGMRVPRGEGLLSTVITYTAAVAAQIAVQLLLGLHDETVRDHNLYIVDAAHHHIDKYAVVARPGCTVCGTTQTRERREKTQGSVAVRNVKANK